MLDKLNTIDNSADNSMTTIVIHPTTSVNNEDNDASSKDEQRALISASKPTQAATQSTTWRIVSFGVNSALIAVHMTGNGMILASLGGNAQAAASLTTTIQSFVNGATYGFLLATGVELGALLGKKDAKLTPDNIKEKDEAVGAVIKTSWLTGGALALLGAAGYLSINLYMPHIIDPATAKQVENFFNYFVIGAFSEPMGGNNAIIIAQVEKNMILPMLLTASYRLPAIGLGYLFANTLGYGVRGVGMGTAIAGIASYLVSQACLSRAPYRNNHLYSHSIPHFKTHLASYLKNGWKLSLQRVTEWGNLVAITTIIGYWSNYSLQALQPAIQANALIGLAMQGMGQAAMMFVVQDCEKQKAYYEQFKRNLSLEDLEEFNKYISINQKTFLKNNLAGLLIATGLSAAIYFARRPIIELFLGHDVSHEQFLEADQLLFYTLLGLLPDSLRIISGGILRGWGDLLYPTIMSLLFMTAAGVPLGAVVSYKEHENILPILWFRVASIALSAAFNFYRFFRHIADDKMLYRKGHDLADIYDVLNIWEKAGRVENIQPDSLNTLVIKYGLAVSNKKEDLVDDFFAQLCVHLKWQPTPTNIKKQVAEHMSENLKQYLEDFDSKDQLLQEVRAKSAAGNKVVLSALSDLYAITIHFIQSDGQIHTITPKVEASDEICIGYDILSKQCYWLDGVPNNTYPNRVTSQYSSEKDHFKKTRRSYGGFFHSKEKVNARAHTMPEDDRSYEQAFN